MEVRREVPSADVPELRSVSCPPAEQLATPAIATLELLSARVLADLPRNPLIRAWVVRRVMHDTERLMLAAGQSNGSLSGPRPRPRSRRTLLMLSSSVGLGSGSLYIAQLTGWLDQVFG